MGPGQFYYMQQIRGLEVCAIAQQSPEEKAQHVPTHWRIFFAVNSVDETVKKVAQAGGKLRLPAMDVPGVGRIAGLLDPQGGAFAVFKPAQ